MQASLMHRTIRCSSWAVAAGCALSRRAAPISVSQTVQITILSRASLLCFGAACGCATWSLIVPSTRAAVPALSQNNGTPLADA